MTTLRARFALPLLSIAGAAGSLSAQKPVCAPGNDGLTLPKGFCAVMVAESLGRVRHLAVAPNGDIFAARQGQGGKGGIVVLRDINGDGRAETIADFYTGGSGSGIALGPDAVYFAQPDKVLRFPWHPGALAPEGAPEIVASGLPTGGHAEKGLALGRDGTLFVSFGSATNSCQTPDADRKGPSPGVNPCPELPIRAGIWKFDAHKSNQTAADGKRWATGLRNAMSLSLDPATGALFSGAHGRDQLTENWSFPAEEGRENPAETFYALTEGTDAGWPYCYIDSRTKAKLQNPEYGGDGKKVGDCASKANPIAAFPGHWAPNATTIYRGTQFPAEYRGGAFIAFHGSWNRAPAPQQGFRIEFVPMKDGKASGTPSDFATPAGDPTSIRFSGLAVGPDGSLYLGADQNQKIWRVMYRP